MHADASRGSFRVVIAGGGVAALETALALRDLAEGLVDVTLVAATDRFTFAPASVGVPFGKARSAGSTCFGSPMILACAWWWDGGIGGDSKPARDPRRRRRAGVRGVGDCLWAASTRSGPGRNDVSRSRRHRSNESVLPMSARAAPHGSCSRCQRASAGRYRCMSCACSPASISPKRAGVSVSQRQYASRPGRNRAGLPGINTS